MSSRAQKFVARSPRYTLSPNDNRFMRFARREEMGHSFTTRFIDISMTGLAFVSDRENAPQISDLIKVEIPLTEHETIAWWARVVRIEEYAPHKWYMPADAFTQDNQVLVAITFHELPAGHAKQIYETLTRKFDELHKTEKKKRVQQLALFMASEFWRILLYAVCIFAAGSFLWAISRPSYNYDDKKGAPWGQRFPWLNLPEEKSDTHDKSSPEN